MAPRQPSETGGYPLIGVADFRQIIEKAKGEARPRTPGNVDRLQVAQSTRVHPLDSGEPSGSYVDQTEQEQPTTLQRCYHTSFRRQRRSHRFASAN
jgi:hypothetical protein